MSGELSVTMAKWVGQQEMIDRLVQEAFQEEERSNQHEAEAQADYHEALNEAMIEYRNHRQDITKAMAERRVKDLYKIYLKAIARRRVATSQMKYLTEKQRVVTAGLYAYNSELKTLGG